MTDRSRVRVGRDVSYMPTSTEETTYGVGPWPATIVAVNADGTADLQVHPPVPATVGAALADPLTTTAAAAATEEPDAAGAAYGQPEEDLLNDLKAKYNAAVTLINELKTDVNALVARLNELVARESLRTDVPNSNVAGGFSTYAGSDAV